MKTSRTRGTPNRTESFVALTEQQVLHALALCSSSICGEGSFDCGSSGVLTIF